MIHSLRQRHRRMFIGIGILLPIVFAFGIAARRPVPLLASFPLELSAQSHRFNPVDQPRAALFANSPIQVQLWRERETGRPAIGLVAAGDFVKPDLIVYWIDGRSVNADTLPADAVLLGAFGTVPLLLPVEATTGEGSLILYSLADQEIVDVSRPTRFSGPTK